jgi:hypothetical protein
MAALPLKSAASAKRAPTSKEKLRMRLRKMTTKTMLVLVAHMRKMKQIMPMDRSQKP